MLRTDDPLAERDLLRLADLDDRTWFQSPAEVTTARTPPLSDPALPDFASYPPPPAHATP